jgi:hypothetical protein
MKALQPSVYSSLVKMLANRYDLEEVTYMHRSTNVCVCMRMHKKRPVTVICHIILCHMSHHLMSYVTSSILMHKKRPVTVLANR